jgi:hypothetical protein
MPLVEKALRAYVKVMDGRAYLRDEERLTLNLTILEALEKIKTNTNLAMEFQTVLNQIKY